MRIVRIVTAGFKKRDIDVALDRLTVASGPCGSGKSQIADAIKLVLLNVVPEIGKTTQALAKFMKGRELNVQATLDNANTITWTMTRGPKGGLSRSTKCSWIDSKANNDEHVLAAMLLIGQDWEEAAQCLGIHRMLEAGDDKRTAAIEKLLGRSGSVAAQRYLVVSEFIVRRLTKNEKTQVADWRDLIPLVQGTSKDAQHTGQRAVLKEAQATLEARLAEPSISDAVDWAHEVYTEAKNEVLAKTKAQSELLARLAGKAPPDTARIATLEAERSQVEQDLGALDARNERAQADRERLGEAESELAAARMEYEQAASAVADHLDQSDRISALRAQIAESIVFLETLAFPSAPDDSQASTFDSFALDRERAARSIVLPDAIDCSQAEAAHRDAAARVADLRRAQDAAKRRLAEASAALDLAQSEFDAHKTGPVATLVDTSKRITDLKDSLARLVAPTISYEFEALEAQAVETEDTARALDIPQAIDISTNEFHYQRLVDKVASAKASDWSTVRTNSFEVIRITVGDSERCNEVRRRMEENCRLADVNAGNLDALSAELAAATTEIERVRKIAAAALEARSLALAVKEKLEADAAALRAKAREMRDRSIAEHEAAKQAYDTERQALEADIDAASKHAQSIENERLRLTACLEQARKAFATAEAEQIAEVDESPLAAASTALETTKRAAVERLQEIEQVRSDQIRIQAEADAAREKARAIRESNRREYDEAVAADQQTRAAHSVAIWLMRWALACCDRGTDIANALHLAAQKVSLAEQRRDDCGIVPLVEDGTALRDRLEAISSEVSALRAERARHDELNKILAEIADRQAKRDVFQAIEWACARAREKETTEAGAALVDPMTKMLKAAGVNTKPFFRAQKEACAIGWVDADGDEVEVEAMNKGHWTLFACVLNATVLSLRGAQLRPLLVEAGETDDVVLGQTMKAIASVPEMITQALIMVQRTPPAVDGWTVLNVGPTPQLQMEAAA